MLSQAPRATQSKQPLQMDTCAKTGAQMFCSGYRSLHTIGFSALWLDSLLSSLTDYCYRFCVCVGYIVGTTTTTTMSAKAGLLPVADIAIA